MSNFLTAAGVELAVLAIACGWCNINILEFFQ